MALRERHGDPIVLSAQGISKHYGQLEALVDLTFELRAGEILGLLGPNGAGKTTAIRVLTTIFPATQGHFKVMDIPDSRPEDIRALIGVVPESNGFPAMMTGEAFLTYIGRLYGQTEKQAGEKAEELLRMFGLATAGSDRIATYSRGMKQRLAMARSLINDPQILFLDEPTLGFDPKGQREMLQIIRAAAEENQVAVVLSSHLLEVVETICRRALILNHGRVVVEGPVADIKKRVSVPHSCRLQLAAETIPAAIDALSSMAGVTIKPSVDHADEIIVSVQGSQDNGHMNGVLQQLINAGISIEAFSRDSARLSDAFLSMIEEVQA